MRLHLVNKLNLCLCTQKTLQVILEKPLQPISLALIMSFCARMIALTLMFVAICHTRGATAVYICVHTLGVFLHLSMCARQRKLRQFSLLEMVGLKLEVTRLYSLLVYLFTWEIKAWICLARTLLSNLKLVLAVPGSQ